MHATEPERTTDLLHDAKDETASWRGKFFELQGSRKIYVPSADSLRLEEYERKIKIVCLGIEKASVNLKENEVGNLEND